MWHELSDVLVASSMMLPVMKKAWCWLLRMGEMRLGVPLVAAGSHWCACRGESQRVTPVA